MAEVVNGGCPPDDGCASVLSERIVFMREYLYSKGLSLLPEVHAVTVKPVADPYGKPLGKGDSIRLDFGRHMTGRLTLKLGFEGHHPDAPVVLLVRFAEVPWEFDEDAASYEGWVCSSWIQEEYLHVDTIPGTLKMARRYAFRYVEIKVMAISSRFRLTVDKAEAVAETSADEKRLLPYSSEESAERLDKIACHTLRDCMQQVFEDGPKRDRRLWMGDLRIQALVNYETYQMNDMVKGCLYLFGSLTLPDGQVAASLFMKPEPCADDMPMFDYSLLFVSALEDYYIETRDVEAVRDLWPVALRQIEIAEERLDERGIVRDSDQIGWCFLDWTLDLNKQAGAEGVLLYALLSAVRLANTLGERETEEKLRSQYHRCRSAARALLYDPEKGLFVSGEKRQVSYASQIWMVLGRAVEDEEAQQILTRADQSTEIVHMVTPYLYHHYVQALLEAGMRKEARDKMTAYWGGMAAQGADTFWELYDPGNPKASPYGGTIVNSYCHAWSCGPAYFLRKYFSGDTVRVKGVIFDLDGVLVSTDEYHYRAWKTIADELEIPFDRSTNNRLRGVSRMDSLEIILENYKGKPFSREEKEKLAERKNERYRRYLSEMTPDQVSPSVREMLVTLKKRGYLLAVGSSSRNTQYILQQTDLKKYFDAVSDGSNITRSKPDPEVFLKASEYLGLNAGNCLVVEDADAGIAAAKAGGMMAAGVQGAAACPGVDIRLKETWDLAAFLD